jgi:hypothetical protein
MQFRNRRGNQYMDEKEAELHERQELTEDLAHFPPTPSFPETNNSYSSRDVGAYEALELFTCHFATERVRVHGRHFCHGKFSRHENKGCI